MSAGAYEPSSSSSSSSASSSVKNEKCNTNSGESIAVELLKNIFLSAATYAASYIVIKAFHSYLSAPKSNGRVSRILKSQKRQKDDDVYLDSYERIIAEDVVNPDDIKVGFADVGGIDEIKFELQDLVVLPLRRPELFRSESGLVSPPRGILLYGAPGTGKTMLAKAMAKEGRATFINVRLSSIMNKFFGESNKLISATFSLAHKLAPSIIFIDELDSFLSQRDASDGSGSAAVKSEFLTLWDGLTTSVIEDRPVIVIGATNRPYDVDSAILRRLPRSFEIPLPSKSSRLQILELILQKHEMTEKARDLIPSLAQCTEGYSGSDLKELCRAAAIQPIRELTSRNRDTFFNEDETIQTKVRKLNEKDFAKALTKVKKTSESANVFKGKEQSGAASKSSIISNLDTIARGFELLSQSYSKTQAEENNHDLPDLPDTFE